MMSLALMALFMFSVSNHTNIRTRCLEDQYYGLWELNLSARQFKATKDNLECSESTSTVGETVYLTLFPRGVAILNGGLSGWWSPVYMEGVDILIGGMRYFFLSKIKASSNASDDGAVFLCNESQPGHSWARQNGIHSKYYNCLYATLIKPMVPNTTSIASSLELNLGDKQASPAYGHPQGFNLYLGDGLPDEWSWLDVGGESYLPAWTPPSTGSACNRSYVDATLAAMMARVMIASNRTDPLGRDVFLSAQHVLDCNQYGQGCAGGTPFEVGKFSEDFGVLVTDYYPDRPGDNVRYCAPMDLSSLRYYFSNYYPLGGYLGAVTSPQEISWEIYRNGPVIAGVKINEDWQLCKFTTSEKFMPPSYPTTNTGTPNRRYFYADISHNVVIVGWGSDNVNGDYWLVIDYAFENTSTCPSKLRRIARGVNAFNIESSIVIVNWVSSPDLLYTHPDKIVLQRTLLICFIIADSLAFIFVIISISLLLRVCRTKRNMWPGGNSFLIASDAVL